jgi:hypothetical protein
LEIQRLGFVLEDQQKLIKCRSSQPSKKEKALPIMMPNPKKGKKETKSAKERKQKKVSLWGGKMFVI